MNQSISKGDLLRLITEEHYISKQLPQEVDNFLFDLAATTHEFNSVDIVKFLKKADEGQIRSLNRIVSHLLKYGDSTEVKGSDLYKTLVNLLKNA